MRLSTPASTPRTIHALPSVRANAGPGTGRACGGHDRTLKLVHQLPTTKRPKKLKSRLLNILIGMCVVLATVPAAKSLGSTSSASKTPAEVSAEPTVESAEP